MNTKLNFDEWKSVYGNTLLTSEARSDIEQYHDINLIDAINNAIRQEYEVYLNSSSTADVVVQKTA